MGRTRLRLTEGERRARWEQGAALRRLTAWAYAGCAVLNLAAIFFFDNVWSRLIIGLVAVMFAVGIVPLLRYDGLRIGSRAQAP